MSKTKNHMRVDKYRQLKGLNKFREKYHILTFKYDIAPRQADKMKHWSVDRIIEYIDEHNLQFTEKFINSMRDVDRL